MRSRAESVLQDEVRTLYKESSKDFNQPGGQSLGCVNVPGMVKKPKLNAGQLFHFGFSFRFKLKNLKIYKSDSQLIGYARDAPL